MPCNVEAAISRNLFEFGVEMTCLEGPTYGMLCVLYRAVDGFLVELRLATGTLMFLQLQKPS